jgi:hypothetical protein
MVGWLGNAVNIKQYVELLCILVKIVGVDGRENW